MSVTKLINPLDFFLYIVFEDVMSLNYPESEYSVTIFLFLSCLVFFFSYI